MLLLRLFWLLFTLVCCTFVGYGCVYGYIFPLRYDFAVVVRLRSTVLLRCPTRCWITFATFVYGCCCYVWIDFGCWFVYALLHVYVTFVTLFTLLRLRLHGCWLLYVYVGCVGLHTVTRLQLLRISCLVVTFVGLHHHGLLLVYVRLFTFILRFTFTPHVTVTHFILVVTFCWFQLSLRWFTLHGLFPRLILRLVWLDSRFDFVHVLRLRFTFGYILVIFYVWILLIWLRWFVCLHFAVGCCTFITFYVAVWLILVCCSHFVTVYGWIFTFYDYVCWLVTFVTLLRLRLRLVTFTFTLRYVDLRLHVTFIG